MGTAIALVVGSGSCPAWSWIVSKLMLSGGAIIGLGRQQSQLFSMGLMKEEPLVMLIIVRVEMKN
jgi:hypothetical protein